MKLTKLGIAFALSIGPAVVGIQSAQAAYINDNTPDGCYFAIQNVSSSGNAKTAWSYGSPYCIQMTASWNGAFNYVTGPGPSVSSSGVGTAPSSGHAFVGINGNTRSGFLPYD